MIIPNRSIHSAGSIHAWTRLALLTPLVALACNQPAPPGSSEATDQGDAVDDGETGDMQPDLTDGSDATTDNGEDTDADTSRDTDTETDTSDGGDPNLGVYADTLYPLADGAHWTYLIKNLNGQILGMDIVDTQEIEWNGEQAFMLTDQPNAKGEWTQSVLVVDGTLATRVHKKILTENGVASIVDYDPGFARVDDTWDVLGFSDELFYDRTETDGDGLNPKLEPRGHIFTVEAVHEQVTVPAGTFDCVKIERVRSVGTNAGELAISWYAFGVGKIREERPAESRIEELAIVSLPGGVQLP
ncbi:TapB family protein [Enhygromyxa salina]|uniref:DUF3108 domain-containing protein n=1 Tax=Enhygromyxa salina TaxID=215803 RepID=A0A2S9YPH8_9BACT|nr:hypothetical protein [Enhygromyxa salina]PRQ06994.1 hypothetical protein ENSA7_33280 [Enhygromyxa salina]